MRSPADNHEPLQEACDSRIDARFTAALASIAAAIATMLFILFRPGAMSPDSIRILQQARSGILEDGHPPLLALIWRAVDSVAAGPVGILALNLALFYGGLLLLFRWAARYNRSAAVAGLVLVGGFPPLIGIIGAIWIDITLAAFLIAGVGLTVTASTKPPGSFLRASLFLAAALLFVAAVAVRHNGAAATAPLVVFSVLFALPFGQQRQSFRRLALACALAAVATTTVFIAAQRLSAQVTDIPRHLWRVAAIFDIAGISHFEGRYLFERSLFPGNSLDDVDTLYSPRSAAPLVFGRQIHALPGEPEAVARPFDPDTLALRLNSVLLANWRDAVVHHPIAYLEHRSGVFKSLITRSPWGLWGPVFGAIYPNDLGVPPRDILDGRFFQAIWQLSLETPLFVPAIYLALAAIALLPTLMLALRTKSPILLASAALYASGLCHMLGLFFTAASADFRYSHWLIAATVVATALIAVDVASRVHRRKTCQR